MTIRRLIQIFIISLFFLSCNKANNYDNEKEIFYKLIPELVDRSCLALPPPPPPLNSNNKNEYLLKEKRYLKFVDSLNNSSKTIAISDSIYQFEKEEILNIKPKINFEFQPIDYEKKILLDLENIKFKPNIKLINSSEIYKVRQQLQDGKSWEEIPSLKGLQCTMSFSRIILNKENNKGFFTFGVGCGKHCGSGFNVWIKKENGKWIIEKQESTWVS
ncbi:hypothetical protein [Soonwooa purpurea]